MKVNLELYPSDGGSCLYIPNVEDATTLLEVRAAMLARAEESPALVGTLIDRILRGCRIVTSVDSNTRRVIEGT